MDVVSRFIKYVLRFQFMLRLAHRVSIPVFRP